ncbi:MAG: hypothetical protein JWO77_2574 [Ilumatobacteraceae bacterium]|nr:hypothetical protein [Ilumatobacteraceae bacterium]
MLPADGSACATARSWVSERLAPLGLDSGRREDLVLCVDELVANVVRHTASSPVLTVAIDGEIRVEVADTSERVAAVRDQDDGVPGGWGLRIVDQVADRWGSVARETGGKVVWFAVAR